MTFREFFCLRFWMAWATYPNTVEELPEVISQAAYSPEDPAAPRVLENLVMIAENHIPLRGTSKLLKKETAKPEEIAKDKKQPAEKNVESNMQTMVPAMAPPFGDMGAMGQFAMMMVQMCKQQMGMGQGNETKVTLSPKKEKELEEQKKTQAALNSAAATFKPQERQLALLDSETNQESKGAVATAATAADTALEKKKHLKSLRELPLKPWRLRKRPRKPLPRRRARPATQRAKQREKQRARCWWRGLQPRLYNMRYHLGLWRTCMWTRTPTLPDTGRLPGPLPRGILLWMMMNPRFMPRALEMLLVRFMMNMCLPRSPRKDESIFGQKRHGTRK